MGRVRCQIVERDGKEIVEEIHNVVVHRFRLSDVEDPDLYAAEPIWNWQQTEAGKFVMEYALEQPVFHKHIDHMTYGYQYAITAELEKKKLTEYYLKFGSLK